MATFLIPFVDLMNKLRNGGIKCMIKDKNKSIKPYLLLCCVDAVARAPMQEIKQYNGKYGCNWCLHPGVFAAGCIRFALLHFIPEARDKDRTIKITFNANSNNTLFGVKYPSPLINLTHFNIIDGFDPDYMHSCLEGVASQITENIIQSLTERQLQSMDSYLRSIVVPHQIMRLTQPLSVRNDWKAREWENFVLYYSIPLYISIRLDKTLLDYWLVFVESLYILLQDHIKVEDVDRADQMLHEFVAKTEQIFGIANMTYNIHQMLHISASVFNWGPLWSHSTFPFESANCNLLKAVKCAKGIPQQILRFIHLNHNTLVLEKNVYKEASDTVRMYCSETLNSRMKIFSQITNITYLGKGEDTDDDVINTLQLSNESKTYRRIVKNECLFTVSGMRSSRTNDSIAQIKDGRYIQIISFIVDDNGLKEITLCQVVHVQPHSYSVMKSVSFIDEEVIAILTDDIRTICIHIVIENSSYLRPVPNLLHY